MGIVGYRVGAVVGDVLARDLFALRGDEFSLLKLWTFSPSIPFRQGEILVISKSKKAGDCLNRHRNHCGIPRLPS
jgi:hypothetical protein